MEPTRDPETAPSTFNILFVCTGNTCRSPMAEGLARAEIERRGWRHVRVASAGAAADSGQPASEHAVSVMARRGIDLGAHSSQPLTRALVDWADLVLAMSPTHLGSVARLGGMEKMALLSDFAAGEDGMGLPVQDPFGGPEQLYDETMKQLVELVSRALDRVAPILQP